MAKRVKPKKPVTSPVQESPIPKDTSPVEEPKSLDTSSAEINEEVTGGEIVEVNQEDSFDEGHPLDDGSVTDSQVNVESAVDPTVEEKVELSPDSTSLTNKQHIPPVFESVLVSTSEIDKSSVTISITPVPPSHPVQVHKIKIEDEAPPKPTLRWNQDSRASRSLLGTALGDAFGSLFGEFPKSVAVITQLQNQVLPQGSEEKIWTWSDDTVAATAVVKTLLRFEGIDQEDLVENLLAGYNAYSTRGFGGGFKKLMAQVNAGGDWKVLAKTLFDGNGSLGNGGAMRSAPIGAFLYDGTPEEVLRETTEATETTHAHIEGIAGAVAVALTSYFVSQETEHDSYDLIHKILPYLPTSETKSRINALIGVDPREHPQSVAELYGTGMAPKSVKISTTSQHTVPFCIWMVQRALTQKHSFMKTLWEVAGCLGDIDTTCAIVGGILASDTRVSLPQHWIDRLEPMPCF